MKKISEKLFFLSYGIYLFFYILTTSFYAIYINPYLKFVMIFCVVLLFLKELLCKKIHFKDLILLILCLILCGILLLRTNESMVLLFLFIYSARNIEFKKITKFTVQVSFFALIFVILSAKLGIILDYSLISGNRRRFYLGFRYPLFPQMILFNIIMADLYTHSKRISILRCLFWLVINWILFYYTNSRLSFYLADILIVVLFVLYKKPHILERKKFVCFLLSISFPLCCLLSFYTTSIYSPSNSILHKVDIFLGRRLSLGNRSLEEYPINFFGNDTKYIGNGLDMYGNKATGTYNYVDCLYINILEKYGIIFNLIFLSMLTYVMYNAWKDKNYFLLIILAGFAAHGIVDDLEIYLYYNVFWLSISGYFQKKKNFVN